jgi:hypothetical protein
MRFIRLRGDVAQNIRDSDGRRGTRSSQRSQGETVSHKGVVRSSDREPPIGKSGCLNSPFMRKKRHTPWFIDRDPPIDEITERLTTKFGVLAK